MVKMESTRRDASNRLVCRGCQNFWSWATSLCGPGALICGRNWIKMESGFSIRWIPMFKSLYRE